jgi:hypothetical protein
MNKIAQTASFSVALESDVYAMEQRTPCYRSSRYRDAARPRCTSFQRCCSWISSFIKLLGTGPRNPARKHSLVQAHANRITVQDHSVKRGFQRSMRTERFLDASQTTVFCPQRYVPVVFHIFDEIRTERNNQAGATREFSIHRHETGNLSSTDDVN